MICDSMIRQTCQVLINNFFVFVQLPKIVNVNVHKQRTGKIPQLYTPAIYWEISGHFYDLLKQDLCIQSSLTLDDVENADSASTHGTTFSRTAVTNHHGD